MKYIIDIPSELMLLKDDGYSFSDGNSYCITGNLSKLTPYTEPDRKAIENEVWEFVRTFLVMNGSDFEDAFGSYSYIGFIEYSYQEAKARYEEWKQNEIHVGDEVEYESCGEVVKFIVTGVNDSRVYGFKSPCEYDDVGEYSDIDGLHKTGRHFDEVEKLLEKMRG